MKKIIAGIDFSDCSVNAMEHGLQLAQAFNADLTMVWVNPDGTKAILTQDKKHELSPEVQERLDDLVEQYKGQLPGNKIEYIIREGRVYQEIIEVAKEQEADLIVIGTHGCSGFEEFWIGSNASRIVMASDLPVLTIREGRKTDVSLTKIAMPIDSSLESRQKATLTAVIANKFDAKVDILAMHTSKIESLKRTVNDYVKQVGKYLDEEELNYDISEIDTTNIADSTIEHAIKSNANLITIMTEQETSTRNLLLGPYASQIINHSPIPVLSVPPVEFIRTLTR
jgi:nucleotide-binding universal stress UspA family protein